MPNALRWIRRNIQAILAFSLLAWQAWIPWSVPHFVTQDGPSHLYTAVVARDLLLHPQSPYAGFYHLTNRITPSWGSTIVLDLIISIVGVDHAQQLFVTLAMVAGFFAFSCAIGALSRDGSRWTPLTNFLLQTWFLWMGFFSFYLAMVLCPLVIGYYLRHASALNWKKTAVLAAAMVALFFTHMISAVLAGMTIGLVALWLNIAAPRFLSGQPMRLGMLASRMKMVVFALLPVTVLCGFYAGSMRYVGFSSIRLDGWEMFPMPVFTTSTGHLGEQFLLFPAVLCLIVLGILTMRRSEWRTARGGVAVSVGAAFLLYLILPDAGLGGLFVKIRFVWGFFILGALLLTSVRRLRPFRISFDIYVFALLVCSLLWTQRTLWRYSSVVESYLDATKQIPAGARLLRIRYDAPVFGPAGHRATVGDPLFHLDAYVAARCRCIDLSDYQAASTTFPVLFNKSMPQDQQLTLWSMERPGPDGDKHLKWLRSTLPVDYVIFFGSQPGAKPVFNAVLAQLNSEMHLVATAGAEPFVRIFQRTSDSNVVSEYRSASSEPPNLGRTSR